MGEAGGKLICFLPSVFICGVKGGRDRYLNMACFTIVHPESEYKCSWLQVMPIPFSNKVGTHT